MCLTQTGRNMPKNKIIFRTIGLSFLFALKSFAQADSSIYLRETIVRGYENNKTNLQIAASLSSISLKEINRYNNTDFNKVLNSQAGVRIEERSPGSYRIAIRGSSLRSPFGVRNVKVYFNNIPISDATGQVYFNQVPIAAIGNIEVLKGPSGSIYGSGIGGVISLTSQNAPAKNTISNDINIGSFGLFNSSLSYSYGSAKSNTFVNLNDSKIDGYREQSAFKRTSASLSSNIFLSQRNTLSIFGLFSKINYETPGGLTLAQMETNRKASRPRAGTNPSSIEQQASILQDIVFVGLSDEAILKRGFKLKTSATLSFSDLQNPFITNYEKRNENSLGTRLLLEKSLQRFNFIVGTELYKTNSEFNVFDNNKGVSGNFRNSDAVTSFQGSQFVQAEYEAPSNTIFSVGLSYNSQNINFQRRLIENGTVSTELENKIPMVLSPRIAILQKINSSISAYATLGRGFSAPTVAEFVSTFQNNNTKDLQAEIGQNHEVGIKILEKKLKIEIAAYFMQVSNGLVRNLNARGNEFFTNAGLINQKGIELSSSYFLIQPSSRLFIKDLSFNLNYTYNDFLYKKYSNGATELSGNKLPGIPKHNLVFNFNLKQKLGFYLLTDINVFSKMPLLDNNTISSDPTLLSFGRVGYEKVINKFSFKVFLGMDNIFNQKYSLGYDFNAFGNRFYNPAPTRNINGGTSISINF